MPLINKENKTIVFSIGDSNRQTHYADVAIPFDTYNELEEDELASWLNAIAINCPIEIREGGSNNTIKVEKKPIDDVFDEAIEDMNKEMNS